MTSLGRLQWVIINKTKPHEEKTEKKHNWNAKEPIESRRRKKKKTKGNATVKSRQLKIRNIGKQQ